MSEKVHELKVWREFFPALVDGSKPFEVRRDDRSFAVGDVLVLREYDPDKGRLVPDFGFTRREIRKRISYKLPGGRFGLDPGFCVLGLADLPQPPVGESHE